MIKESYIDEYAPAKATERLRKPGEWPTMPLALHAQPGAIRNSLADALEQVVPERPGVALVALLIIVAGAMKLGWEARGLWGPIYDQRGWAALVVFSIIGSVYMVNYCNRRG